MSVNGQPCGLDLSPTAGRLRKLLCSFDRAIDVNASDMEAYERTCDLAHVELNGRFTPVWFNCRPIPWDDYKQIFIEARGDGLAIAKEVFRIGCVEVDGWTYEDNGQQRDFVIHHKDRAGNLSRMTDHTFCDVPARVAANVGSLIFNISGLKTLQTDWLKQLSAQSSQPPPKDEHIKNS